MKLSSKQKKALKTAQKEINEMFQEHFSKKSIKLGDGGCDLSASYLIDQLANAINPGIGNLVFNSMLESVPKGVKLVADGGNLMFTVRPKTLKKKAS